MPLFSNQNKFVLFIHIPKCGGSSVEAVLKAHSQQMSIFYADEKHEFPCNPQHFQYNLLRHLTPNVEETPSFTVVRHPLLRVISEYKYREKLLKKKEKKSGSIAKEVSNYFKDYGFDPYIHDNHIRPQIEFLAADTHIFKLENGLQHPVNFSRAILNVSKELTQNNEDKLPTLLKSEYDSLILSGKTINQVQHFYSSDFDAFRYSRVDICNKDKISYVELKEELMKNSLSEVNMDDVASALTKYKPFQHSLKEFMSYTQLSVKRFFKLFK